MGFFRDVVDLGLRAGEKCFLSVSHGLRCGGFSGGDLDLDGNVVDTVDDVRAFGMGADVDPVSIADQSVHEICAIRTDGSLWCWNLSYYYSPVIPSAGVQVTELGHDVEQVAVGGSTKCAIKTGGSLWCWGWGWLGDGQMSGVTPPLEIVLPLPVISVSARLRVICAALVDGSVYCWGASYGALPTRVDVSDVKTLTSGLEHTCALTNQGSLWCWGGGDPFALTLSSTPRQVVEVGNDVTLASAGNYHVCARRSDASIWCWGLNDWGQSGNSPYEAKEVPSPVLGCH
jgi:hypothetical protein